jgi:site-specific recombinase XerD
MTIKRGKISEEIFQDMEAKELGLAKGGNDFDYCVSLFLDELELKNLAYHTRRWHRENLHYCQQTLLQLNLPTEPIRIPEGDMKQCILYWKRKCNLSPTTINHRIRSMKQLYDFLISECIVNHSPMTKMEKMKTPQVIIRPFEDSELQRLLKQPDKTKFTGYRDFTLILVLLDTGVRLIEIENMKLGDVDFQDNKILVMGKGAKEREVMFQGTTRLYLQRYLRLRGSLDHDYLWINMNGNRLNRRTLQGQLRIYGEKANLKGVRVSPHTFRHTCAKMYITNGGDILSLQKLLGHSSLDMVRHYVDLWGSDLQKMHRKYSPVESLFDNK